MTTIECQAELDIAAAGALHQQLLSALQAGEPLEIEAQAVRKIHAAVLQLLLSLMNEAQSLGLSVCWRNPSPPLVESARLLGLVDQLKLGEA